MSRKANLGSNLFPSGGIPQTKAGIKSGDVITAVNGEPVKDARTLARRSSRMAPGTSVKLDLIRKGKRETVTLTLGELPKERLASAEPGSEHRGSDSSVPKLGLTLAPANGVAGTGEEGVVVTDIDPTGSAADRFKTGDVILDVGGAAVSSPADVRKALSNAQADGKRTVLMLPARAVLAPCGETVRTALCSGRSAGFLKARPRLYEAPRLHAAPC